MAEERINRRLAAIMAADVVGYSRLLEQDEASTIAAIKARRREVLEPLLARHCGRIVKTMGDGVLVEFASAVNAVACAIGLQQRMAEANADLPDNRRIILRVGINLGDVVVDGAICMAKVSSWRPGFRRSRNLDASTCPARSPTRCRARFLSTFAAWAITP